MIEKTLAYAVAGLIALSVAWVGCFDEASKMLPPEPSPNDTAERASLVPVTEPSRPYVTVHFVEPSFHVQPLTPEDYREWAVRIDGLLRETQAFFADELERHGYGRQTFERLSHADGRTVIGWHQLPESAETYADDGTRLRIDISELDVGGTPDRMYPIYILDMPPAIYCGTAWGSWDSASGGAFVFSSCWDMQTLSHELGHAFGLAHDWRRASNIMSYGRHQNRDDTTPPDRIRSAFSPGAAAWLSRMPAFTGRIPTAERYDYMSSLEVTHVKPLAQAGWFTVGLSFNIWTYDVSFGRRRVSEALTQAGFAGGVLLNASERYVGGDVLSYFDRDALRGTFYPAGTGVTARHIAENLPLPREAYTEYTLRVEAELPVDLSRLQLQLITEDGFRVRSTLKEW